MLRVWVWLQVLPERPMGHGGSGQGMAEDGEILALIAVVCIAAFAGLESAIVAKLAQIAAAL